jgi:hypothetical protein
MDSFRHGRKADRLRLEGHENLLTANATKLSGDRARSGPLLGRASFRSLRSRADHPQDDLHQRGRDAVARGARSPRRAAHGCPDLDVTHRPDSRCRPQMGQEPGAAIANTPASTTGNSFVLSDPFEEGRQFDLTDRDRP